MRWEEYREYTRNLEKWQEEWQRSAETLIWDHWEIAGNVLKRGKVMVLSTLEGTTPRNDYGVRARV
jgi:hypothetical protein